MRGTRTIPLSLINKTIESESFSRSISKTGNLSLNKALVFPFVQFLFAIIITLLP